MLTVPRYSAPLNTDARFESQLSALAPAQYEPWRKGSYDVAPNLKPLGTNFKNGESDGKVFQVDANYQWYLREKARSPRHGLRSGLNEDDELFVLGELKRRFQEDCPPSLQNSLVFDSILSSRNLDQFVGQVQEDFVVVKVTDDGQGGLKDRAVYLNVKLPSHWAPEEKLGLPFFEIHTVVPGFEPINRVAASMVSAMLNKGPWVRFVWGIQSDSRLDHHPECPDWYLAGGGSAEAWTGQNYLEDVWVRNERQVLLGFPEHGLIAFTIRVGLAHYPSLDFESKVALERAIQTMSEPSKEYKGVNSSWQFHRYRQ